MRKLLIYLLLSLGVINLSFAHSGRTDSSGGHNDHSTGTYHYHNSGFSSYLPSKSNTDNTSKRLTKYSPVTKVKQTKKTTDLWNSNPKWNPNPNWILLGENSSATFYIDLETLDKDSNGYVYFWSMADFFEPQLSSEIMSTEVHIKTNCHTNEIMYLNESHYQQKMAIGMPYQSSRHKEEWYEFSSDKIQYTASEIACLMMKFRN